MLHNLRPADRCDFLSVVSDIFVRLKMLVLLAIGGGNVKEEVTFVGSWIVEYLMLPDKPSSDPCPHSTNHTPASSAYATYRIHQRPRQLQLPSPHHASNPSFLTQALLTTLHTPDSHPPHRALPTTPPTNHPHPPQCPNNNSRQNK
jgi:hypothetical protein